MNQHASTPANRPPDMAARESSEALDAGRPGTGPRGPTPDTLHAAGMPPTAHRAQTAGYAGAAASTVPAHRSNAGAPVGATSREAPTQAPPEAHTRHTQARSRQGTVAQQHTRDKESFDAFMESGRSAPHTDQTPAAPRSHSEPRGDHTGGTPLTVFHQAHFQRDCAARGAMTDNTAAMDNGHATAREVAGQTPDELLRQSAQGSGTRL